MTRTLAKICGLTSAAAVRAACAAGAAAIGRVLAPSPRRVSPARARALLDAVPRGVERLAVYRVPSAEDLAAISDLPFDGVQADARWDGADRLPDGWFFLPVLADGDDLEERAQELANTRAGEVRGEGSLRGAFLIDGPTGGGRGVPADLDRAASAARHGRAVLAGGLRPETVGEALRRVRPAAVDVSSGVESEPGIKDPARVRRFLAAVRAQETQR